MSNVPQTSQEYREWYLGNLPEGVQWGECWCGCEGTTTVVANTERNWLRFKGEPVRFITGHSTRRGPIDYIVEDRGYETSCWIWQRCIDRNGYGTKRVGNKHTTAHRYYYECEYGPIPEGLGLDHLCRVRNCVNPSHLEPVTQSVNNRRGNATKLTQAKADEIRTLYADGCGARELASLFGITRNYVYAILKKRRWSN